jgi:hypothetical protein
MDIIIGWQRYETQFRGEVITMELYPLKVEHYLMLSPFMKKFDDRDEATRNALSLQQAGLPIIKEYVRDIKGLTINGEVPTPELLATEAKLAFITLNILQELFMRSTLMKDEEKNLPLPSGDLQTAETQAEI